MNTLKDIAGYIVVGYLGYLIGKVVGGYPFKRQQEEVGKQQLDYINKMGWIKPKE